MKIVILMMMIKGKKVNHELMPMLIIPFFQKMMLIWQILLKESQQMELNKVVGNLFKKIIFWHKN